MQAALNRVMARLRASVGRAVISLVNDAAKMQEVQVHIRADQVRDKVEHFQNYGFTSVPFSGAEGVVLAVGGSTDHTVVICVDDRRFRLKGLAPGESALYDDQGQKVHLTRNGIVIDGAGKPINVLNTPSMTINSPQVTMTGKLDVAGKITGTGGIDMSGGAGATASFNGNIVSTGTISNNGKAIGSTHTHSGVQSGPSNTGVPI